MTDNPTDSLDPADPPSMRAQLATLRAGLAATFAEVEPTLPLGFRAVLDQVTAALAGAAIDLRDEVIWYALAAWVLIEQVLDEQGQTTGLEGQEILRIALAEVAQEQDG